MTLPVENIAIVDPVSGYNLSINSSGGLSGAGGGPVTIADGANVAQGTTTDSAGANTLVGQTKQIVTNTTGLATASAQTTGNTSLATIATNTGNNATTSGSTSDSAYAGSGSASLVALMKGLYSKLSSVVLGAGSSLIGGVQLIDSAGTNKAAIDAAGNQSVKGGFSEQTGLTAGSLNADLLPLTDVSSYKWFAIQVTGTWSGTLTIQCTNDSTGTTVLSQTTFTPSLSANNAGTGFSANNIYVGPVVARYLRMRMTSYSSGTANGVAEFFTTPPPFLLNTLNAVQSGVWTSVLNPATSGGTSDYHLISAASTNANNIKTSAGQVYGYDIGNNGMTAAYVKLFNKASSPTLGTDTPVRTIFVPAGGKASLTIINGDSAFTNGISIAITGGIADTDSTAVSANQVCVAIDYK